MKILSSKTYRFSEHYKGKRFVYHKHIFVTLNPQESENIQNLRNEIKEKQERLKNPAFREILIAQQNEEFQMTDEELKAVEEAGGVMAGALRKNHK
jgi:hypothetical protein